ncbi:MAG: chitobiase/beta-hexosaminidase C-terminal domain-containing protein [Prevotella sp.]|nr:chitobiase/beta-hexosaminidase C-terminal domain-containing protein [Prevotella sp.]MBP3842434.1 chitobiase/beta-hexosaminidase C-terminal domain-containing protein [Prevotella sp.]
MRHIESTLWGLLLIAMSMVLPSSVLAEGEHQLTVTAKPTMAGSFNTNAAELVAGQSIQLVAYANANFTFLRWTDDKGNVVSQQMNLTYVMPAHDVTLTAEYEYNPANPINPARNYWNKELGEVIVDDFTTGSLQNAVRSAIGDSKAADVMMITVAGVMNANDFGIINTYSACTLLDLSRGAGVTEVPSYAFDYTNLESVYLPATIEKIGYRAFYECKQLSSLIVYAMMPPALENNVFTNVPDGLVVYVPAAAISQYQNAAGWKDFTLLPIQEDIRSISVSLPEGINAADYARMWLELTNTKSGQRMHYVMTDRQQYTFANIIRNTSWNVTLRNERGDVFGRIENVEVKDEDVSVAFTSLSKPQTVVLSVFTPDGQDVTARTQVTWTDAQGNYLAQGISLAGLPTGYQATYRIVLPQELAMAYNTPQPVDFVLTDGNNITCQLTAIPQVKMSGKVKDASTGLPLSGAVISVSQTFGRKYSKTLNTKTDGNGLFTLDIANVPTSVAFAYTDYISQTVNCDSLLTGAEVVTLPDVSLKTITGATISIGFTYTSCEGETQNWYSDHQNVNYELFNVTKNKTVSLYNVQYPHIVLLEEVADGDVLKLTATSRTNAFMPVTATAIIAEQKAEATFAVVELGKIQSSFTSTDNATVIGSLYDVAGKLIKTYSYTEASLTISDLADGNYTLVTMGSSRLFNTIYNLYQLSQTGLTEGTDYVLNSVEVKSGQVTAISISEVPTLDESKLYYTGDNTSFTVNKPSIVAGNYLTLTGRIDFKPAYATSVSNVQMIVDLPESCEFVENSVMVGNTTSSYTLNGNQITIPMARYTDRVRFCIIPTLGGDYAPSAFAQFDLNGETVTQPIGSANYTAKDLSISVPSTVAKTAIPVSGTAIGTSNVEIYDNSVLIGQTTSMANGTWATTCELNEPYNLSRHQIYAKVTTKQGIELTSENVSCVYDMNAIQVSVVKMYHDNPELLKTFELTFDFLNPSNKEENYIYYIYNKKFTFTIDFTNNDTTKVSNVVLYVKTAKSGWHPLKATYDAKQDKWVAAGEFGNMYDGDLPVNVGVDFRLSTEVYGDRLQLQQSINNLQNILNNDSVWEKLLYDYQTAIGTENLEDMRHLSELISQYLGIEWPTKDNNTEPISLDFEETQQYIDSLTNEYDVWSHLNKYAEVTDDEGINYSCGWKDLGETGLTEEDMSRFVRINMNDGSHVLYYSDETMSAFVDEKSDSCLYFRITPPDETDSLSHARKKDKNLEDARLFCQTWRNKYEDIKDKIQPLLDRLNDLNIALTVAKGSLMQKMLPYQRFVNRPMPLSPQMCEAHNKLHQMAKQLKNIKKASNVIERFTKFFTVADFLTDFQDAINSIEEWIQIIEKIQATDCPGMDELAALATKHMNHLKAGYTVSLMTKIINLTVGERLASTPVGIAVSLGLGDFELIQSAWNKINDINWKADIRLQIPNVKCDPSSEFYLQSVSPYLGMNKKFGIDPSGYVYEGVFSNRVEGATATVFYKEMVEDMYGDLHENIVKWNAEEYAQENPLFTDENGFYRWDVPQGLWQVKFEKKGYETTYSEWLPVPPPQLEVNIGMVQNRQPEVKAARAYEDAVEVEFDKYMMPELLTTENIKVLVPSNSPEGGEKAVEGTVELLNEESSYESNTETFASKVRFNATEPFDATEVKLLVSNRVKSYAGIRMQDNYQQTFNIEQEIKQIVSDSVVTVGYGKASMLVVTVLPASASKGKTLTVKTSSPMILGVETELATIGNDGKAEITVSGELPGTAALTFSVEGTDKTAMTIANIEQIALKTVATPKASIASGTLVEKGTAITLTCETEGATIYYTLDGSCPCDNTDSRKVYDGTPIIINETVTIKAMAKAPDMYESDVAEFTYTVVDATGINEVTLNDQIQVYPLPVRDILNVTANGKIIKCVTISTTNGILVASVDKATTKVTLNVSTMPTGIYVINIVTESGSYSRKILKVD